MNNNKTKFKIGIIDGICLGLAILGIILLIAGIIYGSTGGKQGLFNDDTSIGLMAGGGAIAAVFIIIFLIYEIVAVVKIKKAKNVLMLGSAQEAKKAPRALGTGAPRPQNGPNPMGGVPPQGRPGPQMGPRPQNPNQPK